MAAGKGAGACQSGQTALAARLLVRFAAGATADGRNLIFSPLSIHVALALMSAGASGPTLDEILAVAGAPSREALTEFVAGAMVGRVLADRSGAGGPSVAFACGAWTDRRRPLKPAYRDTIVGKFKGSASNVDFLDHPIESRKQINAWVAEATRGLISELDNPYQQRRATVNVVVNAIYFKGEWRDPFKNENTVDREFHRLDGSSVDVPFMQSWSNQLIVCHEGFKVLKLPYKVMGDEASQGFNWKQWQSIPKFSMCVFLPSAQDGLPGLVEKMTSSPGFLHNHLPVKSVAVGNFRLPRFKLAFGGSIVEDLQSLGLVLPFDPLGHRMTEMVEDDATDGPIYVADVIHKAVVDVNEEGSEAAAATESDDDMGFSLYDDYEPPKPVDFVADHPFAFFIIEETSGAIIFAGHVLDPSKEE
ncbi:hypothetical protein ACP70R_003708 [Stipagrostis hirtigluma subsp. patula]